MLRSPHDRTRLIGVSVVETSVKGLELCGMGRPATLPPAKGVGLQLSREVVEAIAQAAHERGITHRAVYEVALRRELGLPDYPGAPEVLQEEILAG